MRCAMAVQDPCEGHERRRMLIAGAGARCYFVRLCDKHADAWTRREVPFRAWCPDERQRWAARAAARAQSATPRQEAKAAKSLDARQQRGASCRA